MKATQMFGFTDKCPLREAMAPQFTNQLGKLVRSRCIVCRIVRQTSQAVATPYSQTLCICTYTQLAAHMGDSNR